MRIEHHRAQLALAEALLARSRVWRRGATVLLDMRLRYPFGVAFGLLAIAKPMQWDLLVVALTVHGIFALCLAIALVAFGCSWWESTLFRRGMARWERVNADLAGMSVEDKLALWSQLRRLIERGP